MIRSKSFAIITDQLSQIAHFFRSVWLLHSCYTKMQWMRYLRYSEYTCPAGFEIAFTMDISINSTRRSDTLAAKYKAWSVDG